MNTNTINGVSITGNYRSMSIINGRIVVDGKDITEIVDKETKVFNIIINKDIEILEVQDIIQTLEVHGNATEVSTTNGSISVTGSILQNASTTNGSIKAGVIHGRCSTVNGSIKTN